MHARLPYICGPCQLLLRAQSRRSLRKTQARPLAASRRTKFTLPEKPVRTRFAPSPTGSLHLGSLRTALFNYLLARATKGSFLLRIEDTDVKRTLPGAREGIYSDLQWAGLQWDEGPLVGGPFGPYTQSDRTPIYQASAQDLLDKGAAYRCFCSAERLNDLARGRKELGLPTDYDRLCASISVAESNARAESGENFTVRLRAPDVYPPFTDLVYGRIGKLDTAANRGVTHKHGEITYEDPVLLKSDGTPTYHLANVVDDHHMRITHVVRATEWLPSTPKHLALYNAFGWEPPAYAHVGLLVDMHKQKLSKRNMDTSLSTLGDAGWLKDTLVNFAALLGCSFDRKSDVMDLNELVESFSGKFTKGNAVVTEEKLGFLQKRHAERAILRFREMKEEDPAFASILDAVVALVHAKPSALEGRDLTTTASRQLRRLVGEILLQDSKTYISPTQFLERHLFFLTRPQPADWIMVLDHKPPGISVLAHSDPLKKSLNHVLGLLRTASHDRNHTDSSIANKFELLVHDRVAIATIMNELGVEDEKEKHSLWCKILRAVLVGGKNGPGIVSTMEILGTEEVEARMEGVLEWIDPYVAVTDVGTGWQERYKMDT
ncbi:MAG: hypothetical protein Q9159_003418 [Coniocarpon cinnabarinum]